MKRTAVISLLLALALLTGGVGYAAGSAPIAENLELCTYRGVAVGGRLSATDPDGDRVTYAVTTQPVKGSIELDEDGHFVYTPAEGKRGKDYFGYRAYDAAGNCSQEATVIIKIEKQKSKVTYADLGGRDCAYAATRLAEAGVYTGPCMGGEYVFSPDEPVSRAEFLALCLRCAGTELPSNVRSTGFSDDRDIDAWAKPYVSAALRRGVISGYADDPGRVVFEPGRSVSTLEAAVMLDRAVGLTDAVAAWFALDGAVPAWALQSAANVSSCGLLPYGCSLSDAALTRGQAAQMLSAAMDILAKR